MKNLLFILLILVGVNVFAQTSNNGNPIMAALPFLDYDPNPRVVAMGEIGVVSSSQYKDAGLSQNPSLLAGESRVAGISLAYSPWMRKLTDNLNLYGLKAFYSLGPKNTIGYSFTYFDYGKTMFTDENGMQTGEWHPIEFFHQVTFARRISKAISIGAGLKYIRSALALGQIGMGISSAKNVNTFAFDLGGDYQKKYAISKNLDFNLQLAAVINNFGPKVTYSVDPEGPTEFIPTKLRLGILANPDFYLTEDMRLNVDLAYQVEKHLVPTPPIYLNNSDVIEKGMDPDISIFRALYQSWYDAPNGFKEEMNEIRHKLGGEIRLNYNDKLYAGIRGGKSKTHESKGNFNYTTLGAGLGIYGFTLDFSSYLKKNSPLNRTWILSLGYRTRLDHMFRF